jgi:hypothetical protein
MARADSPKLDFAYKYPFSTEARELISSMNLGAVDERYLTAGLVRVNEAITKSKIEFFRAPLTELKYTYLMSYVYARMLISAAGDRYALARYVSAEAGRAGEALFEDRTESITKIADELKLNVRERDGEFLMNFEDFVMVHQKGEALLLANQQLEKGDVRMTKDRAIRLLEHAIGREIAKRLPIDRKTLPKEVVEMSRGIKLEEKRAIAAENAGSYAWIEKLLTTPIPDVRHRTVNLILAPYLMNVRKLDEDAAVKAIVEYIERCKLVNPNTSVNETYIRYQCRYSKTKGMRPLAASRARELLAEMIEFG